MYDESYGLRFDIYERVHLSDEHIGIDQLEEVELTPHIQVLPAGEQVTVRGSLLLSGAYLGTSEDRRSQSLEHWIPVEITLPLNRIRSLEEIRVDIENFDVDLLSTRSLNITGVLSLRGIHMEQPEQSAWEAEQFTVVHQASEQTEEPEWLRDYGTGNSVSAGNSEASYSVDSSESSEDEAQQLSDQNAAFISSHAPTSSTDGDEARTQQSEESMTSTIEPLQQTEISTEQDDRADEHDEADSRPEEEQQLKQSPAVSFQQKLEQVTESSHSFSFASHLLHTQSPQHSSIPEKQSLPESEVRQQPDDASDPSLAPVSNSWTWAESPWGKSAAAIVSQADSEQVNRQATEDTAPDELARETASDPEVADWSADAESESSQECEITEVKQPESVPEKPPMKVAIGSSKNVSDISHEQFGISSLLRTNKQARDKEREEELKLAEEVNAVERVVTVGDDVHWQSIFLNRVSEERNFKKVRICIVQRDDTLDQIANRYQMNPREIALHNRLTESSISEGQVLYIPITAVQ